MQAKKNTKGEKCVWNTNTDPSTCADKFCDIASIASYNDHIGCQEYLSGCTASVVDFIGTPSLQGCIAFKICSSYNIQEQFKISSDKNDNGATIECGWNGTACANKSCLTAQEIVNTPTFCNDYLSGCTVNETDKGCVVIPDVCEGMTLNQCYKGSVYKSSNKCFWHTIKGTCIIKKCVNSQNFGSESECNAYLAGCTIDTIKCKTKICEEFPLSTDALCIEALTTCTSNGENCVKRGTCSQALAEVGCVTDLNNRPCQWMIPTEQTAYCTNKTCSTAPSPLTTEAECVSYFTSAIGTCTTKKDGGCTTKGACESVNVDAACTTDYNHNDCQWDNDTNKCRLKECKDFGGTTHAFCYKLKTRCTVAVGQNERCSKMTNCQDIIFRAACIEGNDGPCLWIAKYLNDDSTFGACFSYESCKSLNWTSNENCKLISTNCTTDGIKCIGITSCATTKINGGCKTGTDGECIQIVSVKGANDTICKKFTSCSDAYSLSHEECQTSNSNCTSDYSTGCIPLAACSTYTQNQFYRNKDGAQRDANWRYTFTTDNECSSILKKCTSDRVKSLVKRACKSYTSLSACNVASGTEGACFWVEGCRTKVCSDILNGLTTDLCQGVANCVSNGHFCIARANCSTFNTKTACNFKGLDGICVQSETTNGGTTSGKCSVMTSCVSVGTVTNACTQVNDRCQMKSQTTVCLIDTCLMSKVCTNHTCFTYAAQFSNCKYFYTWDYKNYNACSTVNGFCFTANPDTLKKGDCFTLTAHLYSWNPTSSKCTQCGTVLYNQTKLIIIQPLVAKPIQILVIFLDLSQLSLGYLCPTEFEYSICNMYGENNDKESIEFEMIIY